MAAAAAAAAAADEAAEEDSSKRRLSLRFEISCTDHLVGMLHSLKEACAAQPANSSSSRFVLVLDMRRLVAWSPCELTTLHGALLGFMSTHEHAYSARCSGCVIIVRSAVTKHMMRGIVALAKRAAKAQPRAGPAPPGVCVVTPHEREAARFLRKL
jgi:hypothetical protein